MPKRSNDNGGKGKKDKNEDCELDALNDLGNSKQREKKVKQKGKSNQNTKVLEPAKKN